MHTIEPFYLWQDEYIVSKDKLSPFYGEKYNRYEYTHAIYNYLIHPEWDDIGSSTLFIKILYAEYNLGFCIIELMGEWNDCLYNDIMYLKRNIIEILIHNNINKFILIGENIFNFHSSDDCYYQEWSEEIEDGWIACINFKEYVIKEFEAEDINYYITFSKELNDMSWRTFLPTQLFQRVSDLLTKRLIPNNRQQDN
jgi:hypothetical protein